jgi:hypothetical protein
LAAPAIPVARWTITVGITDLRLDGLDLLTELACRRRHGLDVSRGLAGGRCRLDRLLAGGVGHRGQAPRGVGQFAGHPVGIGKHRGEGRTKRLDFGLDALPPAHLLGVALVLCGNQ